ncbi:hypothetical protein KJQ78_03885 [Campylobacter lari]|nr:hypothetical protein [Campylobacter lari]
MELSTKIKERYGSIKHYSKLRNINYSTLRIYICKYPSIKMPKLEKILINDKILSKKIDNIKYPNG